MWGFLPLDATFQPCGDGTAGDAAAAKAATARTQNGGPPGAAPPPRADAPPGESPLHAEWGQNLLPDKTWWEQLSWDTALRLGASTLVQTPDRYRDAVLEARDQLLDVLAAARQQGLLEALGTDLRRLPAAASAEERDACVEQCLRRLGTAAAADRPVVCAVCDEAIFPTSDEHHVISARDFVGLGKPQGKTGQPGPKGQRGPEHLRGVSKLAEPRLDGCADEEQLEALERHDFSGATLHVPLAEWGEDAWLPWVDAATAAGAAGTESGGVIDIGGIDVSGYYLFLGNGYTSGGDGVWTGTINLGGSIAHVPAPGALALLGLGGLVTRRRRS